MEGDIKRARELLERAYYVLGELSYAILRDSGEYNLAGDIYEFLSTPEQTQDEEPVAWISHNGFRFNADIEPIEHGVEVALYLHPAPCPDFVRLSEEEMRNVYAAWMLDVRTDMFAFARAVEDALEEKNTINKADPDSVDLQSRCRGDKL